MPLIKQEVASDKIYLAIKAELCFIKAAYKPLRGGCL